MIHDAVFGLARVLSRNQVQGGSRLKEIVAALYGLAHRPETMILNEGGRNLAYRIYCDVVVRACEVRRIRAPNVQIEIVVLGVRIPKAIQEVDGFLNPESCRKVGWLEAKPGLAFQSAQYRRQAHSNTSPQGCFKNGVGCIYTYGADFNA